MLNWLNNRCVYLIKVGLLVMPIGLFSGLSQASMLSEAITEVLKSHPKILQKQYESDLLDAKISGLRADYLPTVDLLVAAGTEQIRNQMLLAMDYCREEIFLLLLHKIFMMAIQQTTKLNVLIGNAWRCIIICKPYLQMLPFG